MNETTEQTNQQIDRLYRLLPVVYRQRDEELGGQLRDLLRVIAEQVNLVEDDIRQLYENWFIETCQDWVVPYIGELIGFQPVHEAGEPGGAGESEARNRILIPRREVARTIQSRRRRGTLALLEEVARDAAGWPARAVEFSRLLSVTQTVNSANLKRGRLIDVREVDRLDLVDGPFENLAHTPDMRRINSHATTGRYNLAEIGLFVWRLKEYPVTMGQAACLEESGMPYAYTFSFLGNDAPLFARTRPETDPAHIADESNLPVPIRRRAFEQDIKSAQERRQKVSRYYGEGKSMQIWTGVADDGSKIAIRPVALRRIIPADLSDWNRYRTPQGKVAVDPVLGRIAFHPDDSPAGVWASFYYGFSADMGGGQYHRQLRQFGRTGLFTEFDFKDLVGLARQLKTPASPLNQYVAEQLSAETKQLLKDYDGSDQMPDGLRKSLVAALSKDLNRLLFDERLFDKKRFADTSLDDETERLIGRLLEGKLLREEVGRLNRRLLEQAYRDELAEYFRLYRVGEGQAITSIEKAVELWRRDLPRTAIIEITDNGVYSEPLDIRLDRGQSLQIRAADRKRPIIYLHELRKNRPEWLTITSRTGGCFVLEGVLLTGRSMLIEGAVEQVRIRHCTLVPGWGIGPDCDPKRPGKPSIEMKRTDCRLMIEQSIVGSIQVNKDEVRSDPLEIRITDSVVDATSDEREAVGAASWPRAHAVLRVERSTVIGQVQVNAIALAEDSIFTGLISVTRRQTGCMRFCYVPPRSRTPRRYNCQPDLVEALVAREFDRPEQADERKQALQGERVRVRPQFNSTRYGRPDYCQLAQTCAVEITRGSSDNSEMGVFHNLFQPQRAASLGARLLEFLPAGAEAEIIFVS
jgi:hypothetical protein